MEGKQQVGERAVVVGAGIAGLLAAWVLAERFARVTILERDGPHAAAEPRKGVPQGRHAHVLLASGQQILEALFPGIEAQLSKQGAVRGHGRFFSGGGYHRRVREGPGGLFVSRPCLESEIRARLVLHPNLRIVEGCAARGIVAREDGTRVSGVRTTGADVGSEQTMPADLIVDASGRGSQAPAWLETLGYPKPEVELVQVGMGYSTRMYRREPHHLGGDLVVNVAPAPENTRACGMLAQEGDRWIVTLAGYFGDHPPTDEVGFLEFARSLPTPDVYDVIRTATPLDDPVSYRFPANQRRRYEKLARFPEGFLVLGDAICSFTPIYGQGMTVAALEALALEECLAKGTAHLAQRFFRRAGRVVDIPWQITASNDARLSRAGARRPMARLLDRYMDRLQVAARRDDQVAAAFFRVANLLDAPPSLLRPRVAVRVLRDNLRGRTEEEVEERAPAAAPVAG